MPTTKPKPGTRCETPGCPREIVTCGLCGPCYQSEYYWQKKSVAERRKRKQDLEIYHARMERLSAPRLRRVK